MSGKLEDHENLKDWIGRQQESTQLITPWPMAAMSATLDRDDPAPVDGTPVPPPWHWLYFLETEPQHSLDADGHAARGGFLPPVTLPRRMWAGGRMEFAAPLRVGAMARKVSTIKDVTVKEGRSGLLVFVVVRHEIFVDEGLSVAEEHDIVYREAPRPDAPQVADRPAPPDGVWRRDITADPVLLFRYSALTFNGHRIHYDRGYCRDHEGYPGVVVHGPLTATLLLDLCRRKAPDAAITGFDYRAVKPLFDTAPFRVEGVLDADGASARVWASDAGGALAMEGKVMLRI
ncbi:MAG: MaoC family dehydratase N-terminal domain-containing protein [Rhodospirillales bacterium]|nr:MaoC family dehydratase N-terminal domain-containing protein [Rhodospirillales bacterium]